MGEYQGGVYPSSLVRKALPLTPPSSQRVAKAAASILGTTGDIAHEALLLSVDVLEFAPVLGLQQAARTLLGIWDALQMVDVSAFLGSRLGFLRVLSLVGLGPCNGFVVRWVGGSVSTFRPGLGLAFRGLFGLIRGFVRCVSNPTRLSLRVLLLSLSFRPCVRPCFRFGVMSERVS